MHHPQLEFWYEFASTYSYLTTMRIEELAAKNDVEVVWRPFLLGPILKNQGLNDSPFNIFPAKGRYMWRDVARRAQKYGLPFKKPGRFPANALLAARVALIGFAENWCAAFSKKVYVMHFVNDQDISSPLVIHKILSSLKLPADEILKRADSDAIKKALRDQTELAASLGIFGAPSFVAHGELFWGDDRLEDAIEWVKK